MACDPIEAIGENPIYFIIKGVQVCEIVPVNDDRLYAQVDVDF